MRDAASYPRHSSKRMLAADRDEHLFLAMIAHELRDPLVPLKNLAHVFKSGKFDLAGIEQASRIIDRQVLAIAGLIDDLLDVSRLRLKGLRLRRRQAVVSDIVERAVENVGPLVAARGHTLTVSVPPVSIVLNVDVPRLCQVLHNLIGNAAKYTNYGGKISIDVQLDADDVVIIVSDNGVGIAPADLEAIFEPYEQVEQAATAQSAGGLGLGLYLARSLVEAHGGTLRATSAGLGRGSELIIRLPCNLRAVSVVENATDGESESLDKVKLRTIEREFRGLGIT